MCGRYGQNDEEREYAAYYNANTRTSDPFGLNLGRSVGGVSADQAAKTKGKEQNTGGGNYNVTPGNFSIMILNHEGRREMIRAVFGFRPYWAKKPGSMSINARAEGDYNQDDERDYNGPLGIFNKPFFKDAIRTRRCVLPVNYFIEGPKVERLKLPYVVMRGDGKSFPLAALWDQFREPETGRTFINFAVITTAANNLTTLIGHHRAPLAIPAADVDKWMDPSTPLPEIERMMRPFDDREFFCYKVSDDVRKPNSYGTGNNDAALIQPLGDPMFPPGYTGPDPRKTLKHLKFPGPTNLF